MSQLFLKTLTAGYKLTKVAGVYTLVQVTDADYPSTTTRGVAFLGGRFFVMTPAGEIYQSALEDPLTWSALEFTQSQIEPDAGVYLAKYQNYLVTLKEWSTEFYYDAANAVGSILSPVPNAAFQIGCASASSVKEMAGTVVWMGHTREGFGRSIFQLEGTTPKKLSTPQVEKILNRANLATVYSWAANVGSHLLYGITLVDQAVTLVYDFTSNLWSYFTVLAAGTPSSVSAVSATGVATVAGHGLVDGDIILISGTNSDFNGWHVVEYLSSDSFRIQAQGTAFTGTGTVTKHVEGPFPISASIRCSGKQYMQHATSGALYEFDQNIYTDPIGAIAARIRTPKVDSGSAKSKFLSHAEIVGDKVSSTLVLRYTDDDFATYSACRPVDLSAPRSRIRRLGDYSRRSFELLHVKNAPLRLEALELGDE